MPPSLRTTLRPVTLKSTLAPEPVPPTKGTAENDPARYPPPEPGVPVK